MAQQRTKKSRNKGMAYTHDNDAMTSAPKNVHVSSASARKPFPCFSTFWCFVGLFPASYIFNCFYLYYIEARDNEGKSPLERAFKNYGWTNFDVCLYLTTLGCCNQQDRANLLCEACGRGEFSVVKELIESHEVSPSGKTYCQVFVL